MPKLPPLTQPDLEELLLSPPRVAKLATRARDGTIRITPLWFLARGGEIVMNTGESAEAARNLRRDPRCSLLIDSEGLGSTVALHYRGTAAVEPGADSEGVADIIERYIGSREQALAFANERGKFGPRVFIRFKPEQTLTWDLRQAG